MNLNLQNMLSNPAKSSLLLRRINTPTTLSTTSSAIPTTRKQSQQRPPSPTTTAILAIPLPCPSQSQVPDSVVRHHTYAVGPNQCCSAVIQEIPAPVSTVWSIVRRFDNPQAYKHFVKSCQVIHGDGNVGTLREVHVISGLPAANSTERLEILDDDRHVISFSVIGGNHRLSNYRSVTTLHRSARREGTVAVESYVVDVPAGNTREETCVFVDTIVKCNLQSLARIADDLARRKDPSS